MDSDDKHISNVTGGADVKQRPAVVLSKDDALKIMERELGLLKQKRADCDVLIPGNPSMTASLQQKAFRKMLLHVGALLGMASAFYSCQFLEDGAYEQFRDEALKAMAGKTVGFVDGKGVRL